MTMNEFIQKYGLTYDEVLEDLSEDQIITESFYPYYYSHECDRFFNIEEPIDSEFLSDWKSNLELLLGEEVIF